jgi:predicted dehydrogenase
LKAAIIGAGFASQHHLRAWVSNGVRVEAVVDINGDRARDFAHRYDVKSWYTSVDDMIRDVRPDVVSICTPPHTHRDVAIKLIDEGVNTFVEKPLATNYSHVSEIIEKARSRGVKIWVVMNYLFTPWMIEARRILNRGVIGDIIRADVLFYAPQAVILGEGGWLRDLPGGAFGEVLPHPLYLLQGVIGGLKLIDISFQKLSRSSWMKYDELIAFLKGERGYGRILVSYNSSNFDIYIVVEGSKEALVVNPIGKTLVRLNKSWRFLRNIAQHTPYVSTASKILVGKLTKDPLTQQVKQFIEHLKHGRPLEPSMDLIMNQYKIYEEIVSRYDG